MTVIESVRNFIQTCPYLPEFSQAVGLDYLDESLRSYMVEVVPVTPIVKRYTNGDTVRQLVFVFASRQYYGPDVIEQIENSAFYEHFAEWLSECTFSKELPQLDMGKEAKKIEATTTGYVFNADLGIAQYQIQCRFLYYQERK